MYKKILLTFDFELFLGKKSGSVQNCMLKPTEEIFKILKKYNLSSVFFVDTLYLHRIKELSLLNSKVKEDYEKILLLLRNLIDNKAYIFHHIHPHWLDAEYVEEINEWSLSNKSRYSLQNLNKNEISEVFKISDEIISEIYEGKTKPKYSGFRAGGLFAQPFSAYKEEFLRYNIKIESSLLKGAKSYNNELNFYFDYSQHEKRSIYKFENNINEENSNGTFLEISLDQLEIKGFFKVLHGVYYRLNSKRFDWQKLGDGITGGNKIENNDISNNIFNSKETFSIELMNPFKNHLYHNYLKSNNFLHLLSHPKLFSINNISSLDSFLEKSIKKYNITSDVIEIVENYNSI